MNAQTFWFAAVRKLFSTFQLRRFVTKCLIVVLLSTQTFATPQLAVVYADMMTSWKQEARLFYYAQGWGSLLMAFWQGKLSDKPTKPNEKTQETQSSRDAKVVKLQIAPSGDITIATGERITFTALALSSEGGAVSGVKFNWSVDDISVDQAKRKGKPVITDRGVFYSPIAGEYLISVKDSKVQANTKVIVKGDPQPPIDKLIEKYKPFSYGTLSSRDVAEAKPTPNKIGAVKPARQATSLVAQNSKPTSPLRSAKDLLKQAKSLQYAKGMVATMPVVQAGGDPCGWNNSNWTTADDSGKERGDMPGRTSDGDAGSGNYEFSAPVIGLDSRGLDLELSLDYNSRLWHKANSNITFDIDHDWPAAGWSIGFGRIVSMGSDRGFMIIDGDGTRHGYTGNALAPSGWQYFTGKTIDGTFTDYTVYANNGIPNYAYARLSNGTTISYGAGNSTTRAIYPTQITDAQGNYITISYVSNQGPAINVISDTMNRAITFHYTNSLLTEIKAPGLTLGSTRTLVRMEYKPLALNYNFNLTTYVCSNTINVLKAIYYPATNTGYWFDETDSYSSYGMMTKIREYRNMSYSGGVISKSSNPLHLTRELIYEYQTDGTLSAEPTYNKMKEKWAAMESTAPGITQGGIDNGYAVSTFEIANEYGNTRRRTTTTRPDGTKQVQYARTNLGGFDDGLVFYAKTCAAGQPCEYDDMGLRASSITWQLGDYDSPRPAYIHAYDLPYTAYPYNAKLTTFTYGAYNQVTESQEWGYDGQLKRKTNTTYENSANYTNRHIFKLVKSVEVQDANNVALSRLEYNYDETTPANTSAAVTHHDYTYDPYTTVQYCYPVYDWEGNYITDECYSAFDATTNYRGNVTTVKRYPTPGSNVGLVSETLAYDKTGNLITAATSCCERTTFTYTDGTQFAYAQSQSRGSAADPAMVTTHAVWNSNTGLMEQSKDANQLLTIYEYYPDTLRQKHVWSPTGAYTHQVYDDLGLVVYDRVYFSDELNNGAFTMATGSDKYLDGQGRVKDEVAYGSSLANGQFELDIVGTIYDGVGRVYKQTRPYRYGTPPLQVQWNQVAYDALDRVTQVTEPDGSCTKKFYDEATRPSVASTELGNTIRVQDQWGRERWGRADWKGQMVEVVEPDPSGSGAVLSGMGYKTTYQYDLLNNLSQSQQGDQIRNFKYDGLSRMVAQNLAERDATLNDSGDGGSQWSDVFKYDDRSNLIERIDARKVKTIYDYQSDPLNRIKEVRYDATTANTSPVHAAPTTTYAYETGLNLDKTRPKTVTVAGVLTDTVGYDAMGRFNQAIRTFNDNSARPLQTNYLYDKAGRVREVTYPAQYPSTTRKIAKYNFDEASRYKEMLFGGQSLASAFAYNGESQATALKIGFNTGANELKEEYTYNAQNGLLTDQVVKKNPGAPTTLLSLSYSYAKVGGGAGVTGQLTKIINNLDATKNRFYEYDALSRLKKAKGGNTGTDWTQEYSFDRYGNRTNVAKTGTAPLDAVNLGGGQNSFALSFVNGGGQTVNNRITTSGYQYDFAGNLTRGQDPDGAWQRYEYDAANRLKCVKNDAGTTTFATYTYGASNQRLKTVDGSATNTWYAWEGGKVIAEYNTVSGVNINWQKNYVFMGDRLLATESTTTVLQFHHPDRLGSRLVTNASDGSSAGEQESLPFGTALGAGISGNNRRFTSYDRSTTTKLDYAVNRSYNAGLGRFTQVDPIGMGAASPGDPQSLNLYAYCQNDPINHVDPDGLDPTGGALTYVVISIISAIFGAIRANGGGGNRARTAPIVQKVTFRENSSSTTRSIWTQAAIQSGVGAVSAFNRVPRRNTPRSPNPRYVYQRTWLDIFLENLGYGIRVNRRSVGYRRMQTAVNNGSYICANPQNHHGIPYDNQTYAHQNHPLVRGAKVTLETDARNISPIFNHKGRHSPEYHQAVRSRMDIAHGNLSIRATRQQHDEALGNVMRGIWNDIANGTLRPYRSKEVYGPYVCPGQ